MSGWENPVTRPSVFRIQDAQGVSNGGDGPGPASVTSSYTQLFPQRLNAAASTADGRLAAATSTQRSLISPVGGELDYPPFVDAYAFAENVSRPFTGGGAADPFNGRHRFLSSNSPALGAEGLHPPSSVRTFSQLSAAAVNSPTSAFYSIDVPALGWTDYSRAASMSPGETSINALFGRETLLQRPLGPDTIREAVYAYLEATDRHDVVMAMLADERRHSQRNIAAAASPLSTFSAGLPYPAEVPPAGSGDVPGAHHSGNCGGNSGEPTGTNSVPSSGSHGPSGTTLLSGTSGGSSNPLIPPARESAPQSFGGSGRLPQCGLEGKRCRQRRSHDLLRKGLLERRAAECRCSDERFDAAGTGKPSLGSSLRRGHASTSAFRPSSPSFVDSGGYSSDAAAGAPYPGKGPPTQRQHLPKVLPTLCGLEEALRPDLILLFSNLEAKILEQYRQLSVPPPSQEVLQYMLTQAYEPMWSVGEDANVYHLFQPANPVTGMVLYGTLNQMVEQLTQVHVMPLSTPSEIIMKSGRSFCQAFLRRHRLLMPSHVLLAKLMERYLVPLSLHLGFERFKVHGITVHIPGLGTSLPQRRSQSETVLHGRRHPGATSVATAAASTSAGGSSGGAADGRGGEGVRVWGSRSARQPQAGAAGAADGQSRGRKSAVEEYVLATAAATSPETALLAMVRSGMLPSATDDSLAALTNAGIGAASPSMLTGNAASSTLPDGSRLGGFPNAAAAVAGGAAELPGTLNGAGAGSDAVRPAVELVSTYSPSAALWLTVCERVQLKVLSVLLFWLQHSPHHFDGEMLRSVLHFVETCCYGPCEWSDCPSRQPQIAEFIRQACHATLQLLSRRLGSPVGTPASNQFAAFSPISKEWHDGVLSETWKHRWHQVLSEAMPPSLRHWVKAEQLPWTWITPMGSLTPRQYLPCFAFRTLPTADVMSFPGEARHSQCYQGGRCRTSGSATKAPSDPKLHTVAQEGLRLFGSCTFETYVRGLTAAHYRMFTAFPSQDIFIAAHHTSTTYLTSPAFQSSFLGRFLNSSVLLTLWCVSLLLHAAYLDGERAAAVVAVTNLSILNSFVGDMTDYRAQAASEGEGEGEGDVAGGGSPVNSRSTSVSICNSDASTSSVTATPVASASQNGSEGAAAAAVTAQRVETFLHNTARHFLHVLNRLVDLVVGFLRVNNLHAAYSIFRGFSHPFVKKLLKHRRIRSCIHAQTAHRIRKLEGFFTSIPPTSGAPTTAAAGQASNEEGHAASAGGGGGGGRSCSTKERTSSAAAAFGVGDLTVDDDLDAAGNEDNTEMGAASPTNEGAAHRAHKAHHSFFEYLNTVPDSVEYPTVPVVQYYLHELQMMFALEPTFFTVPGHRMQRRFVSEEARLTGLFCVPGAGVEDEQTSTAPPPIAVVNWRKMHLVDDWIQRVNSNQMSCLHYISSRSTVVRNIVPDLEFEKAFDAQLSRVVVTNTTLLQEMANSLYSTL
ncbi:hypothetical protein ABL78_2061 [Leptomonas seymouri]|uniref:Uncharacterized protein n=1 Tax=Leptomonas seymouri TaxID=5684 RepID=A0A0N0P7X6_LEPSE|nr:hypothetical protein ABL78_2061 [Leptomonas seymouri]|eukprot:KPI88867.1 hypothetical protein ABL78_2061 [Leptomonas seymouri]